MSSRGVKKSGRTKQLKNNRRKRNFIIIAAFITVVGILFSKGSIGQFFKLLAIEAAFVLIVFCLFMVCKNRSRKKSKTVDKGKAHENSYGRVYANKTVKRNQKKDLRELRPRENNYNWIIDESVAKESDKDKSDFVSNRKLVCAGKITPRADKKDSAEDDIKARVASWAEAVDYSGTVFRRIIESNSKPIEDLETETEETDSATESESMEEIEDIKELQETEDMCEADEIQAADEIKSIKRMEGIYQIEDSTEDAQEEEELEDEGVKQDAEELDEKPEEMYKMDDSYDTEGAVEVEEIEDAYEMEGIEEIEKIEDAYELEDMEAMHHIGDEYEIVEKNKEEATERVEKVRQLREVVEPVFPPLKLLKEVDNKSGTVQTGFNSEIRARKLIDTLESFGVGARIINISEGPAVTRYELQPDYGVKVSKIVSLTDDIALNLAAVGVRIEAPIPGKAAIGIEIPNTKVTPVWLREVIESEEFQNHPSKIAFAVGKDIAGKSVVADITAMPHLLIAGATGSGKSVCINTLITSILYKASVRDVRLLMVDPKVVELSIYNGIPHLLIPVVTDPKKAAGALNWAVQEMTNRYKLFAENNVRDLRGYNHLMRREGSETLPQIVIIIDELADLMMVAPNDVENCICRLAQMARAAGMHLVIATQRPSVNVITGVIKANIPSRISFAVSSQVDSRTILDMSGAEKLLGKGDMLFYPLGMPKPVRIQGALITDAEVESIVSFIKSTQEAQYDDEIIDKIDNHTEETQAISEGDDELLPQVINMIIEQEQASTSLIQRKFKIGYARAARIIDQLEVNGMIGPFEGSKPRKVLITKQQWQEMS